MIDTPLFNASDLIDATLTLVSIQEAQLHAESVGAPYDEVADEELTDSSDRFHYLIAEALEEGDSTTLEYAIDTLSAAKKETESSFLEVAVQTAACHSYDNEGRLLETKLFPVLVSRETSHEYLVGRQCQKMAEVYRRHHPEKTLERVVVNPRLLDAEEVYSLRFHEVRELNDTGRAGFRHLVTQGLQETTDTLFQPVLRFLMVQTTTVIADGTDPDLESDFLDSVCTEPDTSDTPSSLLEYVPKELARELANEMAITFGTPLMSGVEANVFVARRAGMLMYAHTIARLSVTRQLAHADAKPDSMMTTWHTYDHEGEDSPVCQIRVSLVSANQEIIAGHILECGNWFSEEDADDLCIEICKWAGLAVIARNTGVIEILDEHVEPYFCNGEEWDRLPASFLRLEQAVFG
jgi:hypothetical protein